MQPRYIFSVCLLVHNYASYVSNERFISAHLQRSFDRKRERYEASCRVCESIFGTQLSSLSRDTAGQMRATHRYFQHGRLQRDLMCMYNAEYGVERVANRLLVLCALRE